MCVRRCCWMVLRAALLCACAWAPHDLASCTCHAALTSSAEAAGPPSGLMRFCTEDQRSLSSSIARSAFCAGAGVINHAQQRPLRHGTAKAQLRSRHLHKRATLLEALHGATQVVKLIHVALQLLQLRHTNAPHACAAVRRQDVRTCDLARRSTSISVFMLAVQWYRCLTASTRCVLNALSGNVASLEPWQRQEHPTSQIATFGTFGTFKTIQ
jgi:hypothetical protein